MYICRSCARKAASSTSSSLQGRRILPNGLSKPITLAATRRYQTETVMGSKPREEYDELSQQTPKGGSDSNLQKFGQEDVNRERLVRTILRNAKDNYSIAMQVDRTLKKGKFDVAHDVVKQASSRGKDVTVAWNHLIEYQLRNQHLRMALKCFNDMKKRQQKPNAQTYTILFRGLSSLKNSELAVSEAIRIYMQMIDQKRLPPNIIHLNAVLSCCAKAKDIDSLFTALKTVEEHGERAPNAWTYTIVFNALRAIHELPDKSIMTEQLKEEKTKALHQAKRIWGDALRRWRSGKLVIDEALVCSMGRLLLLGEYADINEIFTLVKQAMDIPIPDGSGSFHGVKAPETYSDNQAPKPVSPTRGVNPSKIPNPGAYAEPGPNTLSLLLTACQETHKTSMAHRYWTLLTQKPHFVTPDSENWHQLFRTLRKGHSSVVTTTLIQSMPPKFLAPKTFRIALSTCARDNLSPFSFANAGKILDIMTHTLPHPDPASLRTYLRVAAHANRRDFKKSPHAGRHAYARQLIRALERLEDPCKKAWDHAFGGAPMHEFPSTSAKGVRAGLIGQRADAISKWKAEKAQGWRSLDLSAALKAAEDDYDNDAMPNMSVSDLQQGHDPWFDSEDSAARIDSAMPGENKPIPYQLGPEYNLQTEVVALSRRMLAIYDRVVELGGGGMRDKEMKLFRSKRNVLNSKVMRFFEYRNLRETALPQAVRDREEIVRRQKLDEMRTRYEQRQGARGKTGGASAETG